MNSRLTDLSLSGKTLTLNDPLQVFFLPAVQHLPHATDQRHGSAFSVDFPYPKPLPCAGSLSSCLQISRMGHCTLAELTGGLGHFAEKKVWEQVTCLDAGSAWRALPLGAHSKRGPQKACQGTHALTLWMSLGNTSEQGKERMPRQRIVLRWPQSLHGKGERLPGQTGWCLRAAPAQAAGSTYRVQMLKHFVFPGGQVVTDGRDCPAWLSWWLATCVSSRHVPADTTMTFLGPRPLLKDCCLWLLPYRLTPFFPWAIKVCTLPWAMQTSQPVLKVTALAATTLGQSLWVRCLGE